MHNKKKSLVIQTAGINIAVVFHEAAFMPTPRQNLIDGIKKLYETFIIHSGTNKVHYTIEFTEKTEPAVISKHKSQLGYINFFEKKNVGKIITYYHISIAQFQFIMTEALVESLADNGLILHASANQTPQGGAFIFTGPSGTGKSTTMKTLNGVFPALSDDILIVKKEKEKFYMYQIPHYEKGWWIKKLPKKYIIRGVFFLHQSPVFSAKKIASSDAIIPLLVKQLWINNQRFLAKQVKLLTDFASHTDVFFHLYLPLRPKIVVNGLRSILDSKR